MSDNGCETALASPWRESTGPGAGKGKLTHMFECIRTEMKKGSPEGYNAENGYSQPARKPETGEPNERQPLYRIRCTQEKYQWVCDVKVSQRGSSFFCGIEPSVLIR